LAELRGRPQLSGVRSPQQGGALYHPGVIAKVVVVEPNRIVRQGIRADLERNGNVEIAAEVPAMADAIAAVRREPPDIVVLGCGDVLVACQAVATHAPSARIIVLAEPTEAEAAPAVLDAGARAYLLKDAEDLDLAGAVERVVAGESVIDPRAAAALIDSRRNPPGPTLSRQEVRIVALVAEGLTNPEIGKRLHLSRHTVKEYLSHAMRKLEVTNRMEAVRKATELGIIEGLGGQPDRETLAYNKTGEPARSADLKVTPLKVAQLRKLRKTD
jgi:two-component system, NarL family, response regulator DevR